MRSTEGGWTTSHQFVESIPGFMKTRWPKFFQFLFLLCLTVFAVEPQAGAQATTGLDIQMYPGLTITGAVGGAYEIQYNTDPENSNGWVRLTTAYLTNSTQLFFDTTSAGVGKRFYRALISGAWMVPIPGGPFTMGDSFSEGYDAERPTHTVPVSAFWMDRFHVTKAFWDDVYHWATNHGYAFDNLGTGKAGNHPVHSINWYDAVKWCNARSERDGRTPVYYTNDIQTVVYRTGRIDLTEGKVKWSASGYRLPTEAEWERAARGSVAGRRFPWGNTITHNNANYFSSSSYIYDTSPTRGEHPLYAVGSDPHTSPVGSFPLNDFGLADMTGNVQAYCWDWYSSNWYSSPSASQADPHGPVSGSARVVRGGGNTTAVYCRQSYRGFTAPVNGYSFRAVSIIY